MAYLAGATGGAPHVDDFIATLSTFLQANGWVLHDTVAANDLVFRSSGSGAEAIYVRLTKSGNFLLTSAFQWWDVGSQGYNRAGDPFNSTITMNDVSAFNFWCWTDGRAFVIVAKVGANYSGNYMGSLDRIHDENIGVLQAGVAAGAGVVCAVNNSFPSIWTPGSKVMVLDQSLPTIGANEVGNELATVVSAAPGSVTLDLIQPHQPGALIGVDPQPVGVGEGDGAGGIGNATNFRMTNSADPSGWANEDPDGPPFSLYHSMDRSGVGTDVIDAASPDARTGRFLNQPIYAYKTADGAEVRGKYAGIFLAPPTGIGAEDTTQLALGVYIALPLVATFSRMVWVPTF